MSYTGHFKDGFQMIFLGKMHEKSLAVGSLIMLNSITIKYSEENYY
jgi:hypothetical protein